MDFWQYVFFVDEHARECDGLRIAQDANERWTQYFITEQSWNFKIGYRRHYEEK